MKLDWAFFDNKKYDVPFEFVFRHMCQSVQQKSQFHRNKTGGNSCSGIEVLRVSDICLTGEGSVH